MASLLLAAGVLTYDKVKTTRQKRRARKEDNAQRFSELEKDNAERMARLHPQAYDPPTTPLSAERRTPRGEADPFRDSVDVGGMGERRGSGEGRGSVEGRGSEEERMVGNGMPGGGVVGGRPPAYGSLVHEEGPRRRRLKGIFGRKGEKRGAGDGVVR
ncbi:hypothetical protein MMC18_007535 [Xylographa bjoerkii]|nr:hypothetical protein [Xylographa bjoerkii]